MRLLVTRHYERHEIRWDWAPPRVRTVPIKYDSARRIRTDAWPGLVFATVMYDGVPTSLHVLMADEPPTREDSSLRMLILSSPVCLGDWAARDVREGRLDPVIAYFMTGFNTRTVDYVTDAELWRLKKPFFVPEPLACFASRVLGVSQRLTF